MAKRYEGLVFFHKLAFYDKTEGYLSHLDVELKFNFFKKSVKIYVHDHYV
jgi:hypothetical protein